MTKKKIMTKKTNHPYKIGQNYNVRTVTYHFTGRLTEVHPLELVFEDAAWIPDEGRFTQAIANGAYAEVEPYPDGIEVVIGRGALIDAVRISHPLPRVQK